MLVGRWVIFALVVAALVAAADVGAVGGIESTGWMVYDLDTSEDVTVNAILKYDAGAFAFLRVYALDGTSLAGRVLIGGDYGPRLIVADGDLSADVRAPGLIEGVGRGASIDLGPGRYVVVAAAMGNVTSWQVTGAGVLRAKSSEVHYVDGAAFTGGTYAEIAGPDAAVFSATARTIHFEIAHTLLGYFAPPVFHVFEGDMTLTGPNGERSCPCQITSADLARRYGSGEYAFRVEGAGAHAVRAPLAAWVDVPIP